MKKLTSLVLSLAALASQAQTVPALFWGEDGQHVALNDIVSLKFGVADFTLLCTDGNCLTLPLQPITFGQADVQGLQQVTGDAVVASQRYDLMGRRLADATTGFTVSRQGITLGNGAPAPASLTRAASATALQVGTEGIDAQLALSRVDSLSFADDAYLEVNTEGVVYGFPLDKLSVLTFPEQTAVVSIEYQDEQVEGVNPFYFDGLGIRTEGAGVIVSNLGLMQEIEYQLSGSSQNGYFLISSEYKWQATLQNLSLTNPVGPAINSQTGKKGTIKSPKGTVNTLCDGPVYDPSPLDQKACVFSEGQLIFNGKGQLDVTSYSKHGICSDDYVSIDNGNVRVLAAASDAIHAKDSVIIQAGTVTLSPSSDGIDSDGPITIRRGENGMPKLTIITTGDGAKGIKTAKDFLMTDGQVEINQTGKSEVKDGDTSRVIGIKAATITITGGSVVINNQAEGGKPYSADSVTGKEFITTL